MTYGYTYRTTCLENGKVYVGQKRAVSFHPDYLGSGTLIRRAVLKYGAHRFIVEVLEFAESKPELDRAEQKAIIEHRSLLGREAVYNITPGGEGCGKGPDHPSFGKPVPEERKANMRGLKRSEITRHRISLAKIGPKNPMFGKSGTFRGHKHTDQTIERQREVKIGSLNPAWGHPSYGKHWKQTKKRVYAVGYVSPCKGRKSSIETRLKLREAQLGRKHSDTTKSKMALARHLWWERKLQCA